MYEPLHDWREFDATQPLGPTTLMGTPHLQVAEHTGRCLSGAQIAQIWADVVESQPPPPIPWASSQFLRYLEK